eukprot:CAMPEP_0202846782 /NCGR_PEP_ID=MMETSP1389-20130828/73759_1 /ASSEMBLY_ACC=CAM_ASM_000865 /TAXON_ID=302021 /ORGANISM="Rhodomonas sp., Strain CCMP768" /LENGTH=42 /DNA_ID= /DNA_START= /DNA_END= /DNA_ORIENTATION=
MSRVTWTCTWCGIDAMIWPAWSSISMPRENFLAPANIMAASL